MDGMLALEMVAQLRCPAIDHGFDQGGHKSTFQLHSSRHDIGLRITNGSSKGPYILPPHSSSILFMPLKLSQPQADVSSR